MPVQAAKRAENLLLKVSASLCDLRMQGYEMQNTLAKKVDDTCSNLTKTLGKRPNIDIKFLVFKGIAQLTLGEQLNAGAQAALQAVSGLETSTNVEVPKAQSDADMQSLQALLGQIASIMQAFQSIAQNHESTLQRLQQIESGAKNG